MAIINEEERRQLAKQQNAQAASRAMYYQQKGTNTGLYENALNGAGAQKQTQTVQAQEPQADGTADVDAGVETSKVTYIDKNGDRQTGVVETTKPKEPKLDYWAAMKDMYAQQYADAVAGNDAQAAAAAQRAEQAAEEQLAALASQYEGTNRQLYRDYMQTAKVLPQQMAAQGYSGGMSESARLRLNTSYEEALAENERARIAAAAGINSEQAQNLFNIQQAAAEANRQAQQQQNQYLLALEQDRYQYERALQEANAQQMAAAGDFSGYLNLGYTQEQVDYLTRIWLLENPGAKSAWVAAHPAEAKRIGVSATKKYTAGAANTTPAQDVTEAVSGGIPYYQILNGIGEMYAAGDVSYAEAQQLIAQAQRESYQRANG